MYKNKIMSIAKRWEGPVFLEPIEHKYHHRETGKIYKSVTTTLTSIEPHFDSESVSMAIVKQSDNVKQERYIGLNQQQILDYWQMLNDEANIYGSKVHDIVERYLLANKWYFPDDSEEGLFEQKVIEGYENLKVDEGIAMWPERILFAEQYELAGMSDLIIDIDETYFDVWDWKGLPINTPIFTNNGWKTMGTISKSDMVYDMDGKLCKILHVSEVKNKTCYEINFDNNETIVSDFEHRWLVSFYRDKKFKDKVMTTEELYHYIKELNDSGKRWSHKIPKIKITKPLENKHIDLPIDPYLFGVWLGDGHSADGKITNMVDEIWDEIRHRGYEVGEDVSQGGCGKASTRTIFGLRTKLRELGVLDNKHLPEVFLHASYEQRLLVLRGFMDADGYYNKTRKRFVMSTTREWQSKAFTQLISSLGVKPTVINYKKKANGKTVDVIDVSFSSKLFNPFLCRNQIGVEYGTKDNSTFKNIVSINLVESVPTRCIEVGSETKTFLYGDTFSVTHNTNREFNFFDPFGYKTLFKPFEHYQSCQWSVYTLQLSVYSYMYELETGKKCRMINIGYWDKESMKFTKIPIMYVKHDAKKLIEMHYYNIMKNT